VLNGIILRIRPGRKARDYQKIWNTEKNESPLKTITRAQAEKLAAAIADHDHVVVDWAMRYGNPSIRSRIDALTAQGCDRLLVVPLYPQYSAATTATVCDEVFRVLAGMRAQPTLRVTPPYYDDPDYIEALAVSIKRIWRPCRSARADRGLVPRHAAEICRQGRSLSGAVHRDDRRAAQAHGLDASKTDADLPVALRLRRVAAALHRQDHEQLAKDGVRRIAVVTPGFSADCLETLEEIAQENAEIFKHNGGEQFSPHSLPQRQRGRHGRDPPAGAARAAGLDLSLLPDELPPFGPWRTSGGRQIPSLPII
jgi:ferrochelatase